MHTGLILQTIGELLIGFTVLRVHSRILVDKHIDDAVISAIKREQFIGALGMIFIVAGFIFNAF